MQKSPQSRAKRQRYEVPKMPETIIEFVLNPDRGANNVRDLQSAIDREHGYRPYRKISIPEIPRPSVAAAPIYTAILCIQFMYLIFVFNKYIYLIYLICLSNLSI